MNSFEFIKISIICYPPRELLPNFPSQDVTLIFHSLTHNVTDLINDNGEKKNLTVLEADSLVVNCSISSVPEGNYSWNFNNIEIK